MNTLHYIFDPLCGWCYGAAPLIEAAARQPGVQIVLHGGGMLAGANRRQINAQWRDYVMPHDQRIATLSGQTFGKGYFDGLLSDIGAPLDSAPPTTAILAAEELAKAGLDLLHRLQRAHYIDGRRIAEPAVLCQIAAEAGLAVDAFEAACTRLAGAPTSRHFDESRQLLAQSGGQGFPTLVLEKEDGNRLRLDLGTWFGRADEFAVALGEIAGAGRASPDLHCGPDACGIS